MKKNKPTYITDLTTEIMNNRDLLNAWAKYSVDMGFLQLSVDKLSNIDLLFSWDCDNILKAKLAGRLSGNQDFKLKSGMVIKIDESYDFRVEPSIYKKIIKEMIEAESISSIKRKDKLNQGQSLEQIKEDERYIKLANGFNIYEKTEGYDENDYKFLNQNLLPKIIERNNELKRQFLEKKVRALMSPSDNKVIEIETTATNTEELKEKPDFNRNHWNEKCFELFNYLIDNYEKEGNIKYINIFYFLRKKVNKEIYTFDFTIDQYKIFTKSKYNIKLSTFRTAEFDFEDKEVPKLNGFESDFRKQV
jgi:hypothetical protein